MTTRSDPSPKSLRSRLKAATSQEILAAAEAVLAEDGLAQACMATIAQRAGVSVGTLYNYYHDKDALLRTLLAERRAQFGRLVDDAVEACRDAPFDAQLRFVVEAVLQVYDTHRSFLRVVFEGERSLPADGAADAGKGKAAKVKPRPPFLAFADRLRPLTARGVAAGILAEGGSALYPTLLAGMLRGVMFDRLHEPSGSYVEAAATVVDLFLNGARARK